MTEKVTIGNATLYLGDAREVLPRLRRDFAIISDPPYGIGFVKGVSGGGIVPIRNTRPIIGDDRPFDPSWMLEYTAELILWGADHYRARLPEGGRFLAWNKLGRHEPFGDTFADVEFAWHSRKGASRVFSFLWKGAIREGRNEDERNRKHPTQKPTALMRWCIEQAGMPERVVDPYMGSGTTGVACAQLGRRFVGIEIEPRYFEIACRRIDDAQRAHKDSFKSQKIAA